MDNRQGDRRVALVTGASYGVGAAIATALAGSGYNLAITATRVGNLDRTRRQVEESGAAALTLKLDLCSQESIEAAAAEQGAKFDVVVLDYATALSYSGKAERWDAVRNIYEVLRATAAKLKCVIWTGHHAKNQRPVKVYYDPGNPRVCVLEPGEARTGRFLVWFGTTFLVMGIASLLLITWLGPVLAARSASSPS